MKNASGASWVGTVVAVAALAAIGIGGYNFLRTGCPLGTGCDSASSSACGSASASKADACCPLTEAAITPAAKTDCCKGKSAEECCKTSGEGCAESTCGDKSGCAGDKSACTEGPSESHGSASECPAKSGCTEGSKAASPANPG
jgi:hypothetical protein